MEQMEQMEFMQQKEYRAVAHTLVAVVLAAELF